MPFPQQIRLRHGTWAQHFPQKSESKHKLALPESHNNPVVVDRYGAWMDTVIGGLSRTQEVGAGVSERRAIEQTKLQISTLNTSYCLMLQSRDSQSVHHGSLGILDSLQGVQEVKAIFIIIQVMIFLFYCVTFALGMQKQWWVKLPVLERN